MNAHEYTPQQALEVLMKKLRQRDESLATQVQVAIDAGKDVSKTDASTGRRKKKARVYRKTEPFTFQEALQIALDVLQAYFVEQPLFVNSASDNFAKAAIGVTTQRRSSFQANGEESQPLLLEGLGKEKAVEIEIQTETQLSRTGEETIPLRRTPKKQIDEQRNHIAGLRELTNFA